MILPTQPTLSLSLFFHFSTNNGEGVEGGGGVKCEKVESMFNQELTPIGPRPNLILSDPLHCYKKFIPLLEITIGQEKIYGWSAHSPCAYPIRGAQIRNVRRTSLLPLLSLHGAVPYSYSRE